MPYFQREYLREGVLMALNQTYREDLPKDGMLTSLLLKVNATPVDDAFDAGGNYRILDYITQIEIIGNGSVVIKSLDAKSCQFLPWLHQGVTMPSRWRVSVVEEQFDYFMIIFGREDEDTEFGLDLSKWDNVEIRISNNATATQYSTGITLSVLQKFLRDPQGVFGGYLRSEVWRQWTTVANEVMYLELPTEYPISGIYLQATPDVTNGIADANFASLMEDIDFTIKTGVLRLYKGGLDHLAVFNYLDRGKYVITANTLDVAADVGYDMGIGQPVGFGGILTPTDGAVAVINQSLDGSELNNTIEYEAVEAASPQALISFGHSYHSMAWLLHEHMLRPEFMLDPNTQKEINLNIQTANAAGSADGLNKVILERLVTI